MLHPRMEGETHNWFSKVVRQALIFVTDGKHRGSFAKQSTSCSLPLAHLCPLVCIPQPHKTSNRLTFLGNARPKTKTLHVLESTKTSVRPGCHKLFHGKLCLMRKRCWFKSSSSRMFSCIASPLRKKRLIYRGWCSFITDGVPISLFAERVKEWKV